MADLDTGLILRLEASLAKFERQMAKATQVGSSTAVAVEKRFDQMGARVGRSAATASAGITRLAAISGRGRFVLQNTANQLGDMAVQLQGGTAASRVMAQQLPQLFGGFGALGGALGLVAPLLGTIAAIGIPVGAALFAMGRNSEDAAVQLEKINALDLGGARSAIENLTALQERYTEALRLAAATRNSTAIEAVGAIAKEYEAERALLALKLVQTESQLRAIQTLKAAKEEEYRAALDNARALAEATTIVGDGDPDGLRRRNEAVAAAVREVVDAHVDLRGEIRQAEAEETLLELAVNATRGALDEAGGVAEQMRAHVEDGRVSAEGLAAAASGITFSAAASEAAALAAALGVAAANAAALARAEASAASNREARISAQANLSDETGVALGNDGPIVPQYLPPSAFVPAVSKSGGRRSSGGGGGGGGGGSAEVDRMTQAFERLRGQLDPAYASLQKLGEAQETLNWALENGKISLPEYQALLAQANEEFKSGATEVANYVEELGNFVGGFLVDIYQGLRNGEGAWGAFKNAALNALDSIAEAALRMAGNAIVQMLFGGASGGLGGGLGGGLFGGALGGGVLSFAGGGYTGGGSRMGGVDGRGGFPAILHPNETVIDHTKGQGAGVTINITGNLPEGTVRRSGGRIDIDLGRAIAAVIESGQADGAMRTRFGASPRGV